MSEGAKPESPHPGPEICDTVEHKSSPTTRSRSKDARTVRSDQALRNAFLGLLEKKPLDQITIREIASEAGVHYATFFRHHPTKEALLDHVAKDQIDRLVELSLAVQQASDYRAGFRATCSYVNDHRKLWTTLLTGGAGGVMREELLRVSKAIAVERAPKDSWLPIELATICMVSLIVETLSWWLSQPPDAYSVDQVAEFIYHLVDTAEPLKKLVIES